MADIKKINEELEKLLGSSTLGYLHQAEDSREIMKSIISENQSFSSDLMKSAKQFEEIMGHTNVPLAFQSAKDFEHFISPFQSAIKLHDSEAIQEALNTEINPYLKPVYRAALEAFDSGKEGLAYALAHNIDGVTDHLESFKTVAANLKSENHIFDAAKQFSSIASAIDSDIYRNQIDKLLERPEPNSPHVNSFTSLPSSMDLKNTYVPPVFEDTPFGRQTQKLIEHSEQQTSLLKIMAMHLEKQKEHTDRQINLTNIQIEKAEKQADSADKHSNKALFWVKIAFVASIFFSGAGIYQAYYLFNKQDESDNKNHQELIGAVNDKKALESQLSQLQIQISNKNEFVELMKEQNGYLHQLQSQKKTNTNQSIKAGK